LFNATTPICPCSFSNFYDRAEISWAQRWSMSRWKRSGKGAAQDSKYRDEVRLHTPLVSGRMVGGTGGQAISQLQRQSLSSREYIDTSGAHWPVYNIAYRNVRAPTFRNVSHLIARETSLHNDFASIAALDRLKKWNYQRTLGFRFPLAFL